LGPGLQQSGRRALRWEIELLARIAFRVAV
jgi:hypothetical protein